jgi:hypothetical protein
MKQVFVFITGLAAVAIWISGLNFAFERLGQGPYLEWCIENGGTISLAVGFLALIWKGLDLQTELLAWHPLRFFGGCFSLMAVLYAAVAVNLGGPLDGTGRDGAERASILEALWDGLLGIVLNLVIGVAVLAWLVVAAPFHYVLTVFTGAPARRALRGTGRKLVVFEGPSGIRVEERLETDEIPPGGVDVSFSAHAMALTSSINAAVLFVLRQIVSINGA